VYVLKGVERESNPHVFEIGKRKKKNGERLILVQCSIWYRLQQLLIINISSFFFIIRALFSILPLVVLSLSVWCVWWFIINFLAHATMNVKAHLGVCAVYIPFVCSKTISSLSSISRSDCVCFIAVLHTERERVRYNTNFFF
jgi:glucose dehydrogenase